MEKGSMGPASKHPVPIKGQSVLITPKSGRRPTVCGLFFQHFIAPEPLTSRRGNPLERRSKLLLHLFPGRPVLGCFQVATLFRDYQGTACGHAEKGKRHYKGGFQGLLHHRVMLLCLPLEISYCFYLADSTRSLPNVPVRGDILVKLRERRDQMTCVQ